MSVDTFGGREALSDLHARDAMVIRLARRLLPPVRRTELWALPFWCMAGLWMPRPIAAFCVVTTVALIGEYAERRLLRVWSKVPLVALAVLQREPTGFDLLLDRLPLQTALWTFVLALLLRSRTSTVWTWLPALTASLGWVCVSQLTSGPIVSCVPPLSEPFERTTALSLVASCTTQLGFLTGLLSLHPRLVERPRAPRLATAGALLVGLGGMAEFARVGLDTTPVYLLFGISLGAALALGAQRTKDSKVPLEDGLVLLVLLSTGGSMLRRILELP